MQSFRNGESTQVDGHEALIQIPNPDNCERSRRCSFAARDAIPGSCVVARGVRVRFRCSADRGRPARGLPTRRLWASAGMVGTTGRLRRTARRIPSIAAGRSDSGRVSGGAGRIPPASSRVPGGSGSVSAAADRLRAAAGPLPIAGGEPAGAGQLRPAGRRARAELFRRIVCLSAGPSAPRRPGLLVPEQSRRARHRPSRLNRTPSPAAARASPGPRTGTRKPRPRDRR